VVAIVQHEAASTQVHDDRLTFGWGHMRLAHPLPNASVIKFLLEKTLPAFVNKLIDERWLLPLSALPDFVERDELSDDLDKPLGRAPTFQPLRHLLLPLVIAQTKAQFANS
jgi:hypothetical protein